MNLNTQIMSDLAIKVENISKAYRIGLKEQRHDTLGATIAAWVKSPLRNFKKLKSLSNFNNHDDADIFWALRDISFEVRKGEVLGIIGKNGAGKSTLLKILSRITEPTGGRIEIYGRVSSLLEVGTGFNPELTGRENVYLNGTILGMTKKEIDGRFDEIIDFSGIEKFIDTPVKRYSSGMKVRLAFAVAAHLESEILIVDEVLAVGDTEFQKKCLRKMGDISKGEGRTVLFVSHNLAAVKTLCSLGIILENGLLAYDGNAQTAIGKYLSSNLLEDEQGNIPDDFYRPFKPSICKFRNLLIKNKEGIQTNSFMLHEEIYFEVNIEAEEDTPDLTISFAINAFDGEPILFVESLYNIDSINLKKGFNKIICTTQNQLLSGNYSVTMGISKVQDGTTLDYIYRAFELGTLNTSAIHEHYRWRENHGMVYGKSNWKIL